MHEGTAEWSNSPVKPQRWITARTNVKEVRTLRDYQPDFLPQAADAWTAKDLNVWRLGRLARLTGMRTQWEASSPFYLPPWEDTLYFSLAQKLSHKTTLDDILRLYISYRWTLNLSSPAPQGRSKHADPKTCWGSSRRRVLRAWTDSWRVESVSMCSEGYLVLHHRC